MNNSALILVVLIIIIALLFMFVMNMYNDRLAELEEKDEPNVQYTIYDSPRYGLFRPWRWWYRRPWMRRPWRRRP